MSADFRELFDSLAPSLLRYVRRLAGSRGDAEEIVQETFLKLHVHLQSGGTLENPRAWVFRVATNAARDLERVRRVRTRQAGEPPAGNVIDFEGRLERQHRTRRALRRLPRRMRQVLLLWAEGFSYKEIATISAIEPGYVGVLLQRARVAFRREFESGGGVSDAARTGHGLL
jgi:RNA polymerase sigma-70 factor (ECF subfamily)